MAHDATLSFWGLILSTSGAFLLAIAAYLFYSWIRAYLGRAKESEIKKANRYLDCVTILGFALLIVGFALQAWGISSSSTNVSP